MSSEKKDNTSTSAKKLDFKLSAKQAEKMVLALGGLEIYIKGILPIYLQASEAARQELLAHSPILKHFIGLLEASGVKL